MSSHGQARRAAYKARRKKREEQATREREEAQIREEQAERVKKERELLEARRAARSAPEPPPPSPALPSNTVARPRELQRRPSYGLGPNRWSLGLISLALAVPMSALESKKKEDDHDDGK